MAAIRAERDYVVHEDFMKVHYLTLKSCVPLHNGGRIDTQNPSTFISGCAEAKWCKKAGIECTLQCRFWQRVMYDADARYKCIWHVSSGSSVRCDAKEGWNKPAIYVQVPGSSSFPDIHNFSEEDCQADQWQKTFENLVVLQQMLFASVNHTLSASVRVSLVMFHVLVLDCAITEETRSICFHPEPIPHICSNHTPVTTKAIISVWP